MKIIVTGDIHINFSKNTDWEIDRFIQFINTLKQHQADLLVLNGDIFDKPKPSFLEIKYFYYMINELKDFFDKIVVISGNHEDINHKETTFDFLPEKDFVYFKNDVIKHKNFTLYFVSHYKLNEIKDIEVSDKINILFSHFRSSIGMIKQETDVNYISKTFDYTIASDIHLHYKPYDNIEYTSQPYTTAFDIQRDTGFIKLTLEGKTYKVDYIKTNKLPQKIKLNLSVEEYLQVYKSLDDKNLYKIFISGTTEQLQDLPKPKNVEFQYQTLLDEEDIEELVEDLKGSGNVDVIDTLFSIVKKSGELDEKSIKAGEEILNAIRKGVL